MFLCSLKPRFVQKTLLKNVTEIHNLLSVIYLKVNLLPRRDMSASDYLIDVDILAFLLPSILSTIPLLLAETALPCIAVAYGLLVTLVVKSIVAFLLKIADDMTFENLTSINTVLPVVKDVDVHQVLDSHESWRPTGWAETGQRYRCSFGCSPSCSETQAFRTSLGTVDKHWMSSEKQYTPFRFC